MCKSLCEPDIRSAPDPFLFDVVAPTSLLYHDRYKQGLSIGLKAMIPKHLHPGSKYQYSRYFVDIWASKVCVCVSI